MSLKVGDLIIIRTDLKLNKRYGGLRVNHMMFEYKGDIGNIFSDSETGNFVIAGIHFYWSKEMLAKTNKKK